MHRFVPFVLAIEPDSRQAAYISRIADSVGADLLLVEQTAEAVNALQTRAPDLVLVPALLSPADDAALVDALHTVAAPAAGRILITPRFSGSDTERSGRSGFAARWWRSRKRSSAPEGCDPKVFAEQVATYLEEARQAQAALPPVVETHVEDTRRPTASAVLPDEHTAVPNEVPASEASEEDTPDQAAANEPILVPLVIDEAPPPLDVSAEAPAHDADTLPPASAPAVTEQEPASIVLPVPDAGDAEWHNLVVSLQQAVGALRFEEWLGQDPATKNDAGTDVEPSWQCSA